MTDNWKYVTVLKETSMIDIKELENGIFLMKLTKPEVHTLDVPELKEEMLQMINEKGIKKLVLDLTDVRTITSSGIGIFLNINQVLKSDFRIANPSHEVRNVLELTKLDSVVKVFETTDIAIKSF